MRQRQQQHPRAAGVFAPGARVWSALTLEERPCQCRLSDSPLHPCPVRDMHARLMSLMSEALTEEFITPTVTLTTPFGL